MPIHLAGFEVAAENIPRPPVADIELVAANCHVPLLGKLNWQLQDLGYLPGCKVQLPHVDAPVKLVRFDFQKSVVIGEINTLH